MLPSMINKGRITPMEEPRTQRLAFSKPFENIRNVETLEDGGNIGGSGVHFPSTPGTYLADLRSRANSQQYSSIYED